MKLEDFSIIIALTTVMTVLLSLALNFIKRKMAIERKKRYDFENKIVELEYVRKSYEDELYEINKRLLSNEARWKDLNHLIISNQNRIPNIEEKSHKIHLNSFLEKSGISENELIVKDDLVFYLTPFNDFMTSTFKVVTETCNEVGLKCLRGDENYIEGDVFPSILKNIIQSRLIIANIDGRNPNVFYELGIAHALDKPVIIIAKKFNDFPFDIKSKQILVYQDNRELQTRLKLALTRVFLNEKR